MRNMQSFIRAARILALAAMVAAGAAAQSQAAPIVSIAPPTQSAAVGDTVSVDIVVSGLTEPVGAYYVSLLFNSSILSGDDFTNDPDGKMGPLGDDFSGGFSAGALELFYVADASWTAADLTAAQGASFILASVSFTALANGTSPFTLDAVDLSDATGDALLTLNARNGQVCVGGPCDVPEPGFMVLVLSGVASLVAHRRVARRRA